MTSFDENWKFTYGIPETKDIDSWQAVTLPHDGAITLPLSHGGAMRAEGTEDEDWLSEGSNGYFQRGKCCYAKRFSVEKQEGERAFLIFEGIYRKATLLLNDTEICTHENGYLGFEVDVTDYLKTENTLIVIVDNSRKNTSRWYTGTGIYRHTFIDIRPCEYVKRLWVFPYADGTTEVNVERLGDGKALFEIVDASGKAVASCESDKDALTLSVERPVLWSVDNPYLYTLRLTYFGKTYEKKIGYRKIELTRDGVFVNGASVFVQGFNIHHDLGIAGAAAYNSLIRERLEKMRAIGVNGIRLSHNPHAPEMLDMCDEMGFLVFDECFDKLDNQYTPDFEATKLDTLREFIYRDHHHPCVYVWSVGNETNQQRLEGKKGAEYIAELCNFAESIDKTREATCAQYPARENGIDWTDAGWRESKPSEISYLKRISACNYTHEFFERDMRLLPQNVFIQSEAHVGGNDMCGFENVKRLNVCGQFYWGGVEYLGEAITPEIRGWARGFMDISNNKKAICYQAESAFCKKPIIHIGVMTEENTVVWNDVSLMHNNICDHWNFLSGTRLRVIVYTNCEEVELFINGNACAAPKKGGCCMFYCDVTYESGKIEAIGKNAGKAVANVAILTHGEPKKLVLTKTGSLCEANDGVGVDAFIYDENGTLCQTSTGKVQFYVENGYIASAGNSNLFNGDSYGTNTAEVFLGTCRAIVRSNILKDISVRAVCGALTAEIDI